MARFRGGSTNGVMLPSYTGMVTVKSSSYTAPYDGWLLGFASTPGSNEISAYINDIQIGHEYNDYIDIQIPLAKGDIFTSNGNNIQCKFLKFKGA